MLFPKPQAPTGAVGEVSPDVAARWPAEDEWPGPDTTTLEAVRFYRERLGAWVYPTPSSADELSYAKRLRDDAYRDFRDAHAGQTPPDELAMQIWDDARVLAAKGIKGAAGWALAQCKGERPTSAHHERWFGDGVDRGAVRPRGVCIALGKSVVGLPLAQVDTDPRHGGDVAGPYATLAGPRASTPGGGVHCFVVVEPGAVIYASAGCSALAPGVEVRVDGFAVLPSGHASAEAGRSWLSTSAPLPAPAALRQKPAVERRGPPPAYDAPAQPWDAPGGSLGRVAWLLANDIEDGRNAASGTIVGLLARPVALPTDVVTSALGVLFEYGVAHDWDAARLAEEAARWRTLLTRGPRDPEFAVEFVQTWLAVRDIAPRRWSAAEARATARSLWKTADRREEGRAGAEDMGHAGVVADRPRAAVTSSSDEPTPVPAPVPVFPTSAPTVEVASAPPAPPADTRVLHGAGCGCESCVASGDAAKEAFLRRILPFSADSYPDDVADADMQRVPLRVDCLYPFYNFWPVAPEPSDNEYGHRSVGHGYGRWLSQAIGGLLPGDFKVIGGAGAKIGKTHFVGQMVEGLALSGAARVLGIEGYSDAPIVMPVWVTEMPKPGEVKYRMLSRHFGFDMAALTMAQAASEAAGIVHMAKEDSRPGCTPVTPLQVVEHARRIVRAYRSADRDPYGNPNPVAFVLRHMMHELALSEFPAPTGTGRNYVDHSTGVNLIGHLADAVALRRRDLARRLEVTEDKVTPLVIIDPGQRFIGGGDSAKRELDAFLSAVLNKICRTDTGIGAVVLMTSDTTKAAAKEIDLDMFKSESGQRINADIFAGSQAMMHVPDTIIAVCSEEGATGSLYRRTQWVRVTQGRVGAPSEVYPFEWTTHLGRFRPRPPQPLMAANPGERYGAGGGHGSGDRSRPRAPAPNFPGAVGDISGPRLPPRKQNGGLRHPGHRDD